MATLTDPARELFELCKRLPEGGDAPGETVLATAFQVEAWSAAFYEVNFSIVARIQKLKCLIDQLELEEDTKADAIANLNLVQNAFGAAGHRNPWSHTRKNFISPTQLSQLSVLSGMVRQMQSYPKLTEDESAELLALTIQLHDWLNEHQLVEQDFIRECLIEGVERFRFRLERLAWMGWGYTAESLRDVIAAYFALERSNLSNDDNPIASVMLKNVADLVSNFYNKTKFAKDVTSVGDFMLRAYGAASVAAHAAPKIVGLLTN